MNGVRATKFGLSGTALKLIAAALMIIDHAGLIFEPMMDRTAFLVLRAIGRVSMPVFAFMIAEGCRYTSDRRRYFANLFLLGVICTSVMYVVMDNTVQLSIFTTFSLGVLAIYAYDGIVGDKKSRFSHILLLVAVVVSAVALDMFAERNGGLLEYGITGVLLPLSAYIFKKHRFLRLLPFAALLALSCLLKEGGYPEIHLEWFSLVSVALLALYNGERGRYPMKYFFYVFYPMHIVVLYGIFYLIQ